MPMIVYRRVVVKRFIQGQNQHRGGEGGKGPCLFLASPDALEVIVVSHSLTYSVIVSTDLTDVTLVSDDTY